MGRRAVLALPWVAALLAAAAVLAWLAGRERQAEPARAAVRIERALAAPEAGYVHALEPREFRFPADHAAHPGFKTEWWYFTGNLATDSGRRFGYQLTFFRSALAPEPAARASTFAATHAWMAHFTLSDVAAGEFHDFERFAREGAGLAGAGGEPLCVRLRDWTCTFSPEGFPARLSARAGDVALELELAAAKPPVLHGDRGLSRKHADPRNASYYYSLTRLATTGTLEADGRRHAVTGASWMDREWSSGALGPDQLGWDWFALQLDDGTELMWYRLRRADGAPDPFAAGTYVAADGAPRALSPADVALEERARWTSPRTRAEYPARWSVAVEALGLALEIEPLLADQELGGDFRYWEGAVQARGTRGGVPVLGRGYVELVGYADAPAAPLR